MSVAGLKRGGRRLHGARRPRLTFTLPPHRPRSFKALSVLEFILRRGSDDAVARARSQLSHHLEHLGRFAYVSPDGRDHGQNVRLR